jgi:hypothetical protein
MRAAAKRFRMTPFMIPTNGAATPKSVVRVITPEGCAEELTPHSPLFLAWAAPADLAGGLACSASTKENLDTT